jgi:carbon-monoxide dehydrogenase small subunit
MDQEVTFTINGQSQTLTVEPRLLLIHAIRDILGLTGAHVGCDTSQCGSCTVIIDGDAVKACTILTVQVDGSTIETVEGLGEDNESLNPVQEGLWKHHGLQCGFCTPGIVMLATNFLKDNPNPTEHDIRRALAGNLCRCTGYQNIVKGIQYAAEKMKS